METLDILVIDDDPLDTRLLVDGLKKLHNFSFNIDTASSLAESEQKVSSKIYDCIYLDYRLPDGDGISFLKDLSKKFELIPPVILLTGDYREELGIEAISSGAQDFLVKGQFSQSSLNQSLKFAIERNRILLELNKVKKEALAARKEADASNMAKDEFLANMSHEIRTPMTAILGFVDLINEGEHELSPEFTEYISIIEQNGNYLLNIINDILDLSKIEAGKLELEYAPLCLFEFSQNIKGLLEVKLAEKRLDFDIKYELPLPKKIITDQTRLRQILINLLGNSIKFTQKGSVTLSISWLQKSKHLLFEIKDSGIGMSEDQLAEIFESFKQADSSISKKFGGTGLGLAITKRLTEIMGGKISVKSKYGKGTTFRVEIKAEMESDKLINKIPSKKNRIKNNIKFNGKNKLYGSVLLVDDNLTNLTLISKILTKMNLVVECCNNGQEAIDLLLRKGKNFQVVLMDVQMPVMDGMTAAGILKQRKFDKPVIALTANNMTGFKEKCLEAGFCNFASKPVDRQELYSILSYYLIS